MDAPIARAQEIACVRAAAAGDERVFETLVRANADAVYAHALRFFGDRQAAEDVVQEVFLKMYRSLSDFDGRSSLSTWLYRVTRNACLDALRSGARSPQPIDPVEIARVATNDTADEALANVMFEQAIRSLPPEDRDALSAVTLFGLSYAQAGDVLGVPEGTVKSRVFRARRALTATLARPRVVE